VRYATSSLITGPYVSQKGSIITRDNNKEIFGPGHHDILNYKGELYILYHRQHFPMIDAKRQRGIIRKESFSKIEKYYKADYAFDNNYGTHWQSADSIDRAFSWIMVDLGKDTKITDTEIFFEYTIRSYYYTLEYLPAKYAESLEKAATSKKMDCLCEKGV